MLKLHVKQKAELETVMIIPRATLPNMPLPANELTVCQIRFTSHNVICILMRKAQCSSSSLSNTL